jgi:hypothetical protein
MANSLLTTQAITREAIRLFKNSNRFLQSVDRQYDGQFARTGAKIGANLNIRLPNDYVVRRGPTAAPQDTVEKQTPVAIANQTGVDIAFSTADRALSLDDYSRRVLAPAINVLAGAVASDVMGLAETIPNVARNADGSNNTISPNMATFLTAGAILDRFGVSRAPGQRMVTFDPTTQARTVASFSTLFNDQNKVSQQYREGVLRNDVLGFDWQMDQTVILHTTGAYGALPTVAGANQSGSAITVSALAGPLKKGDFVSFAGVNSVNRITKQNDGVLARFVVTADVAAGSTSIPIYPALIPPVGGVAVPYQTVSASPANGAAVTSPFPAGETYRKNVVLSPDALTMVSADLEIPGGVHEAHRESFDGISMRLVTAYNIMSDQMVTRLDLLYGFAPVRPEFAAIVADAV